MSSKESTESKVLSSIGISSGRTRGRLSWTPAFFRRGLRSPMCLTQSVANLETSRPYQSQRFKGSPRAYFRCRDLQRSCIRLVTPSDTVLSTSPIAMWSFPGDDSSPLNPYTGWPRTTDRRRGRNSRQRTCSCVARGTGRNRCADTPTGHGEPWKDGVEQAVGRARAAGAS